MGTFQIDFGEDRHSKIVGIDLGTTNSLIAVMDLTGPRILEDAAGRKIVPSIVSSLPDGRLVAGEPARELLLTSPEQTVYSVKRLMGRGVSDVRDELKLFPFRIANDSESVIKL
jgi:molecular chaperone DnaK